MSKAVGEIILTHTTEMTVQHSRGAEPASFGSFIITMDEIATIGVVNYIETSSRDPNRQPLALGLSQDQLTKRHPQLATLIRTQFRASLIGTLQGNSFTYRLPGAPPPLHAQVRFCNDHEIQIISQQLGFLRLLYETGTMVEELLLTVSHRLWQANGATEAELIRIGKALSELYRDDYDSLRRLLERLEQWQT